MAARPKLAFSSVHFGLLRRVACIAGKALNLRNSRGTEPKHELLAASAIFKLDSKSAEKNCAIGPEDILRCSKICAVLLAPDFHPLISEPRLFEELNAATEGLYVDKPIHFETVTISGYPQDECGDFEFSNGQSESPPATIALS